MLFLAVFMRTPQVLFHLMYECTLITPISFRNVSVLLQFLLSKVVFFHVLFTPLRGACIPDFLFAALQSHKNLQHGVIGKENVPHDYVSLQPVKIRKKRRLEFFVSKFGDHLYLLSSPKTFLCGKIFYFKKNVSDYLP